MPDIKAELPDDLDDPDLHEKPAADEGRSPFDLLCDLQANGLF